MFQNDNLQRQIQEAKVLNAELTHLNPNTCIYERQVPSSNVFFLAKENQEVVQKSSNYQKNLEKQLSK